MAPTEQDGEAPPPWLPPDFVHPTRVDLASGHHLRPITEGDTPIDYPAVMGSRERLWSIFGPVWGWPPTTMTFEQDRDDLIRHEREADAHQSFNYCILNDDETELLGCIYVDPPEHDDGRDAQICWWVVDDAVGSPLDRELESFVPRWIAEAWPFTAPRVGPPD